MAKWSEMAATGEVIALDLGTSSARAFRYDAAARRLGGTKVPYAWTVTADGGVEVAAETLLEATAAALDGVLAEAEEPIAVGWSALWHTLLGVGGDGAPVTPVYAWSDTRSGADAAVLRAELDGAAVHARTGAELHPSYLPARLRWLRRTAPERFAAARWWMSAAEYLGWRLFGERRVSLSIASATGLLDQRTCRWDDEILAAVGLDAARLSPLVDLAEPYCGLVPDFAGRWPLLARVPWLPAAGDGACANLGSGCATRDRAALSMGSSGALRSLFPAADDLAVPRGLWHYRLDREHVVVGGAVSNGGNVYRWLRETLRLPDPDELEAALATLPPDGHGLTTLAFLSGERSPTWPLHARAAIVGLGAGTTPAQIAQALLEAVGYRLALVWRLLRPLMPERRTVVASGAALRASPAWTAMLAAILDEPLTLARDGEASSRGAALLALAHAGALGDPASVPATWGEVFAPDPGCTVRYAAALERYTALDDRLLGGTWPTADHVETDARRTV